MTLDFGVVRLSPTLRKDRVLKKKKGREGEKENWLICQKTDSDLLKCTLMCGVVNFWQGPSAAF